MTVPLTGTNFCEATIWRVFIFKNWAKLTSSTSFWYFCCYLWTYFTPFSSVSIVDFEQVNISWEVNLIFFLPFCNASKTLWRPPQQIFFNCSKPTVETWNILYMKYTQIWRRSGVLIFNFERKSHFFLVFLLTVWACIYLVVLTYELKAGT